jgi:hypothetical protein
MGKSQKVFSRRMIAIFLTLILMCSLPVTAFALPDPTPLIVGPSGDYATIQAAVDAAASGDTILVQAGTYYENVVVNIPDITIQSIEGPDTTTVVGIGASDIFTINQPGVTIDGFTIDAEIAGGIYLGSDATSATITDNILFGNKIFAPDQSAIYVNRLLNGSLTITGNAIGNFTYGIYQNDCFDDGTVLIDNNSITNVNYAIDLDDYSGATTPVAVTISNNTITYCRDGIYMYELVSGTVDIIDNDISFFIDQGIEVDELGDGSMQISSNTLTDGREGIYLSGGYFGDDGSANITITDNEFLRCSSYGLYFYGIEKGTLLVSRNTAIDCYTGLCIEEMGEDYVVDAQISYNNVYASGDELDWSLYEGISICCPEQETFLSFNKVSGYEYGFDIGDIGCCGVEPVIFTINNNEAFDCDYGFYIEDIPCCMPGNVYILNNWAHDNTSYGMYIEDVGDYESEVSIMGNIFTDNLIGLFVYSIDESNVNVSLNYNGFVNNIRSYVTEDDFNGLDATANWWAKANGPSAQGPEGGDIDMVVAAEASVYTPWVTSLAFDKSSLNLSQSSTNQLALIATLSDDTTVQVTDYVFSYTSSNKAVATVSASGLVTAIGNGTAVITAQCMGYDPAPSVTVTVGTPVVNRTRSTTYTIGATAGMGGAISPNGTIQVAENGSKAFIITPDTGYEIRDVLVDGKSVGKVTEYAFSGISSNHTIEAQFVTHETVCAAKKFSDVDTSLWYHEGIDFAFASGLFKGTSETTFEPNADMTRAMLVSVLWRLDKEPNSTAANLFADIASGTWYAKAVTWAAENDIVAGYNAELFGPNDTITREQMASILYRYATYKGYDLTPSKDLTAFSDAGDVSTWAITAMKWAVGEELITGVSAANLEPAGKASRAQVAAILMRFVDTVVK